MGTVKLFLVLLVGVFLLSGCYYDNVEELYPGIANCDTTNVTFSGDINPVIQQNCAGCHSGGAPSGNIDLSNYDNIRNRALIPPGSTGSLYGAVSHYSGNSPMPKGQPELQACTVLKVKVWIDNGAPNN